MFFRCRGLRSGIDATRQQPHNTGGLFTARIRAKREAQQRIVEMIMPEDTKIMMQHMGPDERLGGA
jgi:hypothetical protein